jgi:hypothetical protein
VASSLDTYSHVLPDIVLPDMQKHATIALDRLLDG